MSYTMEDFRRDYIHEHEDEILEHISIEKRLQSLSVEELKDYLAKSKPRTTKNRAEIESGVGPAALPIFLQIPDFQLQQLPILLNRLFSQRR